LPKPLIRVDPQLGFAVGFGFGVGFGVGFGFGFGFGLVLVWLFANC